MFQWGHLILTQKSPTLATKTYKIHFVNEEVEAWFYYHCLLKYPSKCASAGNVVHTSVYRILLNKHSLTFTLLTYFLAYAYLNWLKFLPCHVSNWLIMRVYMPATDLFCVAIAIIGEYDAQTPLSTRIYALNRRNPCRTGPKADNSGHDGSTLVPKAHGQVPLRSPYIE